ncbi:DUF2268 domain-containing protein [Halalkalibacter krulwichiae]|uniref:DUF2268 domain-containing protein n=1 Tax=Halalkalibacter krulwichiae TaxID=199441 RepID=A0A1X9MG35_9BACI|nr:DUF2268 domain-containing putative Zn-dependent protease [Halalkalibacter krulwichiae]ARK31480.1 hypothetical protein BkAM31D_17455 [Halalkalibacter krulwichiae]
MGVVRTDKWLEAYLFKWKKATSIHEKIECQRDVIIQPLSEIFLTEDLFGLQHYLIQMGLFGAEQAIEKEYEKWTQQMPWSTIQRQFEELKHKWAGPDVKIYVLPLNDQNSFLEKELGSKTGLTIGNAILLFIRSYTKEEDLKALITHEYHHVCRLKQTKQKESSMILLESMVMEGLAEIAVKEEVGQHYCAPWTTRYDQVWESQLYERLIKPNLYIKGRTNHHIFLYGDEQRGVPLWLGYYVGYKMADTALRKIDRRDLISIPAEIILEKSEI